MRIIMQILSLSLLLLINLLPVGCATHEEISLNRIESMPVTLAEVIDSVAVGQEVWFKITASTPSPCWKFHHMENTRDKNEVLITVYAEYVDQPCIQTTSTIEAAGSLVLHEPGVYTFKFWQEQGRTLNKKVVVE